MIEKAICLPGNAVANDLYEKGLIEEGNYTIDIDW